MSEQAYQVLARKWRPQRFEDVVGQEHVSRTLRNAIVSGRIHHAFLFIGSRGIGKTTSARILAKALNCLSSDTPTADPCGECDNCRAIAAGNSIDVIEIDGASNNGVDNVREIRENIRMVPTNGRYKVYIIDEVHQLSQGAFNALLKTLEEPPPHAVFVLATTEAHKVPATIISRCQRYDFRRVAVPKIVDLLSNILQAENRQATPEALQAIARAAEGGIRDAESILDELLTYCDDEVTLPDVVEVIGMVDWKILHELCDAILRKDIARQLGMVEEIMAGGKDLGQFVEDLLRYFRNLLVCKTADASGLLHVTEEELEEMNRMAAQFSLRTLISLVEQFSQLVNAFDSQLAQRIALESLLIRLSKLGVDLTVDTVLEKLMHLGVGGLAHDASGPPPTATTHATESPPDPPEAGRAPAAPPAPAHDKRMTVEMGNLRQWWNIFLQELQMESLVLATKLSPARPARLDGATLEIGFPSDQEGRRIEVEQPANRAIMDAVIQRTARNITGFTTTIELDATPPPPPPDDHGEEERNPSPSQAAQVTAVDPKTAARVLEDEGIATTLRVFRGQVIRVIPAAAVTVDGAAAAPLEGAAEATVDANEVVEEDDVAFGD